MADRPARCPARTTRIGAFAVAGAGVELTRCTCKGLAALPHPPQAITPPIYAKHADAPGD
jgi:hypothetical protein